MSASTSQLNAARVCRALHEQRRPAPGKDRGHPGGVRREFDPSSDTSKQHALRQVPEPFSARFVLFFNL